MTDERSDVIETIYQYATGIDTFDWALYRSIFTDEVTMDFEAWNQIPKHRIRADDLQNNIRLFFAGLDATQHVMTNPIVSLDGDHARCVMYIQAYHFLHDMQPSRRYVIGGYYTDNLVRQNDMWKIASVKLDVLWTEGDFSFMHDAAERGRMRLGEVS